MQLSFQCTRDEVTALRISHCININNLSLITLIHRSPVGHCYKLLSILSMLVMQCRIRKTDTSSRVYWNDNCIHLFGMCLFVIWLVLFHFFSMMLSLQTIGFIEKKSGLNTLAWNVAWPYYHVSLFCSLPMQCCFNSIYAFIADSVF